MPAYGARRSAALVTHPDGKGTRAYDNIDHTTSSRNIPAAALCALRAGMRLRPRKANNRVVDLPLGRGCFAHATQGDVWLAGSSPHSAHGLYIPLDLRPDIAFISATVPMPRQVAQTILRFVRD